MISYIKSRADVSEFVSTLDEEDLKRIEMDDKDPDYFQKVELDVYLVKGFEGANVGFFGVWPVEGYMQTPLFVKKEYRSKGYGKILIDFAEYEAKKKGYRRFLHRIKKDNNTMMKLSESCGYGYHKEDEDYVIMTKEGGK